MKNVMRFLLPSLCACCACMLFATESFSQSPSCSSHPTEPGAQFVAGFTATVPLSGSGSAGGNVNTFDNSGCQSHNEICIWLMPNGRLDIVIGVGSMTFSGDCDGIDSTPLDKILDVVAPAVIEQAILFGHPPCTPSTTSSDTIDVLSAACADRLGSGDGTTFSPCDNAWCKRRYQVVCTGGTTVITGLAGTPSECSGGNGFPCEAGCPDGTGINLSFETFEEPEADRGAIWGSSTHRMPTIQVEGPVRRFRGDLQPTAIDTQTQ